MGKTKKILRGKFPKQHPSLDEQVRIANRAGDILLERNGAHDPEAVCDDIDNFALWLGGINPDVQVYAWQLIRRHHQIEIMANDKTHVRLEPLEEKIFLGEPYVAQTFNDIEHFAWPKQWLGESTFEERLATLAEEYERPESPSDMLLSGMGVPDDLDYDQRFQLAQDCIEDITAAYKKYGKANVLINERTDRFLGWLLTIEPELMIAAMRSLLIRSEITLDAKAMPNYTKCLEIAGPLIR